MITPTASAGDVAVPTLFVLAFGAIIGSFLSMLVYRLPLVLKRQWEQDCRETLGLAAQPAARFNLAWPASHCPTCQAPLRFRDNVPIIGFLLLRGRCRHCRAPIPIRYLAIEILTMLAAWATLARFGITVAGLLAFALTAALIALSFIDAREQILPDVITLPFLWLGLLANIAGLYAPLAQAVLGAACAYGLLWLVFQIFRLATGKEGMGYGDFKLFALAGAWLGWPLLPLVLLLGALLGALFGVVNLARGHMSRETPMPFGPFLCFATWVGLFFGKALMAGYLRAVHG